MGLLAIDAATEKKAEDPVLLDLAGRSSIADYFVVLTGTSDPHVLTIADAVVDRIKREKVRVLGVEGQESAQWVLIDAGYVVIHVFRADARAFYDIDGLWPDAARVSIPGARQALTSGW